MNDRLQDAAFRWILSALAVQWRDTPAGALMRSESSAFWDAVKALAFQHRVAGPLYDRTLSHPALFPEHIIRWLRLVHSVNLLRCGHWSDEVSRLLRALAAAEVRVLLLKGWALAAVLYEGDLGRRPAGDLDIVVAPVHVGRCRKILAQLGYAGADIPELWPGFNVRYHASTYRGQTGSPSLTVDVHTRPWRCSFDPALVGELMDRAQPVRVGRAEALAPAAEDHLLCLCAHLTLNHQRENLLFRYHDLADLIHAKAEAFDWDAVLQRTANWGLVLEVQCALSALAALWPETVPAAVLSQVAEVRRTLWQRLAIRLVRLRVAANQGELIALLAVPGVRKLRFILEQMFPSPAYMRWRYCPRRPALLPFAYARRLVLGLRGLFS